jgi:hypothetical protein
MSENEQAGMEINPLNPQESGKLSDENQENQPANATTSAP